MKVSKRGGKRRKRILRSGQARLLEVLWAKFGGVHACGKLIGVPGQYLTNWKLDGKVPLQWIGRVSRALAIKKSLINYTDIYELHGAKPEEKWALEISKLPEEAYFSEQQVDYILSGSEPKLPKFLQDETTP